MDSSKGRNLTFGLTHRRMFLHMGSRMSVPSKDRTNPAPRDIHTENVSVFRPASFMFDSWRYLGGGERATFTGVFTLVCYLPSERKNTPMAAPEDDVEEKLHARELPLHPSKDRLPYPREERHGLNVKKCYRLEAMTT